MRQGYPILMLFLGWYRCPHKKVQKEQVDLTQSQCPIKHLSHRRPWPRATKEIDRYVGYFSPPVQPYGHTRHVQFGACVLYQPLHLHCPLAESLSTRWDVAYKQTKAILQLSEAFGGEGHTKFLFISWSCAKTDWNDIALENGRLFILKRFLFFSFSIYIW